MLSGAALEKMHLVCNINNDCLEKSDEFKKIPFL